MAVAAEILRLSQPSLTLSASDVQEVQKLAEVLKLFMQHQGEKFVNTRLDEPIAEVIMQDITPIMTHTVHSSRSEGLAVVIRRGRTKREWLVQRIF